MINVRLEKLNGDYWDPELLDRTLEFGEALGSLQDHQGIITSNCTEYDYLMQGYQEYLSENGLA
jgi:hypothetical protein